MLHIRSLTKGYGAKVLFENSEVHLGEHTKVALIGPNGAGKSTLIRMILGEETWDTGDILLRKHLKIGHLAQELPKFEDRTIFEEALRLDGRREELLRAKRELEATLETDASEENLDVYSQVLQELDAFDEYRLPSQAEQILEGIGFEKKDFNRSLSELSGGWLMRVALARILLLQPDLLILDEPTNHLDLESILWLEEFLKNYRGSIILVSHDRTFVNRLVDSVWEIDQKKINPYQGNLDSYVIQKQERLKVMEAQHAGQQQKIAEIRAFVDRFGAKATKARQAQSRLKQLEKIESEMIELPDSQHHVQFTFPPCIPSGKEVLTIKNAGMSFGDKTVFSKFDWILQRGSRVAIVGVNGAGKTTLLKALSQSLPFSEGTLKVGHQVQLGYYSQLQAETLNLDHTIMQELELTAPKLTISQIRGVAGAFLFSGDTVHKKIKVLSGGEKARVALAKLLLMPNNFLLLDEPTNHLDADSREVLLQALMNYPGTLCLVSHDRDFVAPLVDQLLEIQEQRITPLISTYEEYLSKKVLETKARMKPSTNARPTTLKTVTENTLSEEVDRPKSPSNNQKRYWEKEFKKLESEIQLLDQKQSELNRRLAEDDFTQNQTLLNDLIEEQTKNQALLDQKMNRWEELGTLLT